GRIIIETDGTVLVQAESNFANAQCFTSLDGATYAVNGTGFSALSLVNGWGNYGFGTANAAVRRDGNIVRFRGAIATSGTSTIPTTLPVGMRPTTNVYVPVDLCNATKGRLIIGTNGVVQVQAETNFANAQCFTSLEGAWFAMNPAGFTNIPLVNGWAT